LFVGLIFVLTLNIKLIIVDNVANANLLGFNRLDGLGPDVRRPVGIWGCSRSTSSSEKRRNILLHKRKIAYHSLSSHTTKGNIKNILSFVKFCQNCLIYNLSMIFLQIYFSLQKPLKHL
jgi:hypothetical protein